MPFSLEQMQEMADNLNISGIAYETKIGKDGIARLYPKVIVSKADEKGHKPKNGMHSRTDTKLANGSFENTGNCSGEGKLVTEKIEEFVNNAINPEDSNSGNMSYSSVDLSAENALLDNGANLTSTDGITETNVENMTQIEVIYQDSKGNIHKKAATVEGKKGVKQNVKNNLLMQGGKMSSTEGDVDTKAGTLKTDGLTTEHVVESKGSKSSFTEKLKGTILENEVISNNGNITTQVEKDADLGAFKSRAKKKNILKSEGDINTRHTKTKDTECSKQNN